MGWINRGSTLSTSFRRRRRFSLQRQSSHVLLLCFGTPERGHFNPGGGRCPRGTVTCYEPWRCTFSDHTAAIYGHACECANRSHLQLEAQHVRQLQRPEESRRKRSIWKQK